MSSKKLMLQAPELRFPEFRSIPSWQVTKLEDVFDFLSTTNNSRADLSPNGDTFYVHYGDLHTKHHVYLDFSKVSIPRISNDLCRNAATLKNGDLILADASEDIDGVAKAVEVEGLPAGVKAVSGLHTILLRDRCDFFSPGFKGLLREIGVVKKQVARLAVGVKVYAISKSALRGVLIPFTKKEEQQKIAGCLSSIDNLITAQTQKIEALKVHKKSLMQPLFPAEGKAVPHFRFPEFRDSEGWREIVLGKIISLEYGRPLPKSARVGGSISVVGSNGIVGFHNVAITKGPTIVIGRKGSVGQVKWIDSDCFPIDTTFFVKNLAPDDFLMRFIFILLENCNLKSLKDGGAIPGINRNSVYILKSFSPNSPEQQKIADCLSSIDELIIVHSQKLEALKTLKRGLMQCLFPSTSEGEA